MFGRTNTLAFILLCSCKVKLDEVTYRNRCMFTDVFHWVIDWWVPSARLFLFLSTVERP